MDFSLLGKTRDRADTASGSLQTSNTWIPEASPHRKWEDEFVIWDYTGVNPPEEGISAIEIDSSL